MFIKRFIISLFNLPTPTVEEQLDAIRKKYNIEPSETVEEAEEKLDKTLKRLRMTIKISQEIQYKIRLIENSQNLDPKIQELYKTQLQHQVRNYRNLGLIK